MSTHTDRPTTTSTALVVLATLATATVLVRAIGVSMPATLGGIGAVLLAVAVWTAGWQRYRAIGTALSSLLALPVGIGLVAATIGTVIVLAGVLFPVSSLSQLSSTVIDLSARAMVVVGAVAAVFGATVAVGNVLDRETAKRATATSFKTMLSPLALGLALMAGEVLAYFESNTDVPGVGAVVGDVLRAITTVLFDPPPVRPNLTTFLLLAAVALIVTRRALGALPLSEVAAGTPAERAIAGVRRALFWASVLVTLGIPIAILSDFLVPTRQLRRSLSPALFELLTALTTAQAPRALLWWTIVLGVATLLVVALLRRLVQSSADRIGATLAPFAAGAAVVVGTTVVAGPVLSALIDWVADTLPGEFGPRFRELSGAVVEFYGPLALVMTAIGVVLLVATLATTALWLTLLTKYLDDRTAGVGIASAALFQTAAFAGVVGVSTTVLFGSLIAAVLVWDVGEFGTTLGREIGGGSGARRTELVHATGMLAVGGVGATAALAIEGDAVGAIPVAGGTVVLGLVAVLAGLLALLVALR